MTAAFLAAIGRRAPVCPPGTHRWSSGPASYCLACHLVPVGSDAPHEGGRLADPITAFFAAHPEIAHANRVTRDFPIDLPPDRVDANGDAFVCATEDCTNTPSRVIGVFHFCPDCAQDLQLPTLEYQRPGEDVVAHGARVLTFLLATSCTATLTDLELDRAHLASQYAICAKGISVPAANRLSEVRHLIASTLRHRERETHPVLPCTSTSGSVVPKNPIGGDRVPLEPLPKVNPPAPAYAGQKDRVQF